MQKLAINPKHDGYQRRLAFMANAFFDKKTGSMKSQPKCQLRVNEVTLTSLAEELAQELHKPVIKKFKRRKVYARYIQIRD